MPGPAEIAKAAGVVCTQRNYSLIRELGAGAQKRAYLVEHAGHRIALKIGPITSSVKPRFEREATALAGCKHEAIAILHEAFGSVIDGQEYWISIEEYLAGGTLADRLAAGGIAQTVVREIGLRLASAISHLEERNFVHRDIKPANILFRTANDAVLTDFGIVRMLDASTLTQAHLAQGPGTPLYAAPEQLHNEQTLIDSRTDQFGLALVLAEAVLHHHAFAPEQDPNLALARLTRREPIPHESAAALTAAGFGMLIKALAPWPAQRFRFPDDFLEALKGG